MRGLFRLYRLAPSAAGTSPYFSSSLLHMSEDDELPPGRLKQLRERIRDGFYRRPEVMDEVARRLTDDVTSESDEEESTDQP